MMSLGPLAFAAPWALAALVLLPGLWWLLRLTPPPARRQVFPPLRLLLGLPLTDDSPARTPPWLLALRLALALALILGLARPLWHPPPRLGGSGPLLLVVDDGWAAGRDWPARRQALDHALDQAEREHRLVALLTTAAPDPAEAGANGPSGWLRGPLPAAAMRRMVQALRPHPWPVDRAGALAALDAYAPQLAGAAIWWLADGVDDGTAMDDGTPALAALAGRLRALGRVRLLADGPQRPALLLRPPSATPSGLRLTVERSDTRLPLPLAVEGYGANGQVLAQATALWPAGQATLDLALTLPVERRNDLTSLRVGEGARGAGAVILLDGRWRRQAVGLIDNDAENLPGWSGGADDARDAQPLLSPFHYLEQALTPFAAVRRAPLANLLAGGATVLVLTDRTRLAADDRRALEEWMDRGGLLLRFAGPTLADGGDSPADALAQERRTDDLSGDDAPTGASDLNSDGGPNSSGGVAASLLPVRLRAGDRVLGGALSWSHPAALAPFDKGSPFAGLVPPADVTVSRQVLAQPSPDLDGKVWARLEDGTPLVTATHRGRGWLVLVHTTPDPRWSNLALSGLFVDMLRRIVDLGGGTTAPHATAPLPPLETLDGEGRLTPPPSSVLPLAPARNTDGGAGGQDTTARVDPHHPPGYYGAPAARLALNLAPSLPAPRPFPPLGLAPEPYGANGARDLTAPLLGLAFLLWLTDLGVAIGLRGLWRRPGAAMAALVGALLLSAAPAPPARAAGTPTPPTADDVAAATHNWLAYVVTGDPACDATSRAGLTGLAGQLNRRTAVDVAGVRAIDVERDDLAFYPLLYWAVPPGEPTPSQAATRRLNHYLHTGGMILFDTRDPDGTGGGAAALRRVTQGLDIPRLTMVDGRHVLARSFFLLRTFPGRDGSPPVWVEAAEGQANDGVSGVIIGSADWAGAWAVDGQGRPLNAVTPGGERQREMAYRFGINVVMYALTGNYKADQVHVPAILERLGQ